MNLLVLVLREHDTACRSNVAMLASALWKVHAATGGGRLQPGLLTAQACRCPMHAAPH